MMSQTRAPAPQPVPARTSRAFRLSTSILAAMAVLMATATVPQLALPASLQWLAAAAAAGIVFVLSDFLLAATIIALPAVIFAGGMFGVFAR